MSRRFGLSIEGLSRQVYTYDGTDDARPENAATPNADLPVVSESNNARLQRHVCCIHVPNLAACKYDGNGIVE